MGGDPPAIPPVSRAGGGTGAGGMARRGRKGGRAKGKSINDAKEKDADVAKPVALEDEEPTNCAEPGEIETVHLEKDETKPEEVQEETAEDDPETRTSISTDETSVDANQAKPQRRRSSIPVLVVDRSIADFSRSPKSDDHFDGPSRIPRPIMRRHELVV